MRPLGPIRAFLYARSASDKQIALAANANKQLQHLRAYAQKRSCIVIGEACDAAKSANRLSRPGLTMVMSGATCTPPTFDLLLATNPSRLARDFDLFETIVARLTKAGIKIGFAELSAELDGLDDMQEKLLAYHSWKQGGYSEER
ncbi:recombinase family protein [Agrobacterium tumefaciens]|uniref:recombinase family protein n=1 Tax=Agrobacterium tumefaciens TaxID=358 RepID=UPI001574130A|nr:recombinase family protein [Agrobacterium tumefaciens]NTA18901.1 recombinase family protein [Agrobacterium tumefaciens]WCK72400.1 recombinase family protein [Agrobacterium tumefaciens]